MLKITEMREWLNDYSLYLKNLKHKDHPNCLSATTKFVSNMSTFFLREDPDMLPEAFIPLFEKSINIIKSLAFLSPPSILKFDPQDQNKVKLFEEKLWRFSAGETDDSFREIMDCSAHYITMRKLEVFRQGYLYWSSLVIFTFDLLAKKYSLVNSNSLIILKKGVWPWPYDTHRSRHGRPGFRLSQPIQQWIPKSWDTTIWLLFDLMLTFDTGPFHEGPGNKQPDINISKELIKVLQEELYLPEMIRREYLFPHQIPLTLKTSCQQEVTIQLDKTILNYNNTILRNCFTSLHITELILDNYISRINFCWKYLRGEFKQPCSEKINNKGFLSFNPMFSKKLASLMIDFKKWTQEDIDTQKEVIALIFEIEDTELYDDSKNHIKSLKKSQKEFKRLRRNIKNPGNQKGIPLNQEQKRFIRENYPIAENLFKKFRASMKEKLKIYGYKTLDQLHGKETDTIIKVIVTSLQHHQLPSYMPSSKKDTKLFWEKIIKKHLKGKSNRRQDFVINILISFIISRFNITIKARTILDFVSKNKM